MKLYVFMVAPNPTRVRLYLAEKAALGCAIEVEQVAVDLSQGEHRSEAHLARNRQGSLPVLERDDGSYLTESHVIVEYLEELHPEPPMIGRDPESRAAVRRLERIAETGVLVPTAYGVHMTNSPLGMDPVPGAGAFMQTRMAGSLALFDELLSDGRPFLAGDQPTIADCTLAAGLQFGRFGKFEPEGDFGNVARWDAAYRARPHVRDILVM